MNIVKDILQAAKAQKMKPCQPTEPTEPSLEERVEMLEAQYAESRPTGFAESLIYFVSIGVVGLLFMLLGAALFALVTGVNK